MDPNLLIKYTEQDDGQAGYDLGLLGESFSGFNDVFKELFEISQIQGDLIVRTARIEEGSIDVCNLIQVIVAESPFKDPKDLMDFLQVVDATIYQQASNFFSAFGNAHKTVNDFFKEYEFSGQVVAGTISGIVSGLTVLYFPRMIAWAGKQKNQTTTQDENGNKVSERYAKKLRNMVNTGRYKKALKPISENSVSSVSIGAIRQSSYSITIDESKLGDYLPEEEKILPEFENGQVVQLSGEILAISGTRGERLKFKATGIDPRFDLLTGFPQDDKKTEDYTGFYKKQVNIKAEIFRKTLYKKPEIIIKEIELSQTELFPE